MTLDARIRREEIDEFLHLKLIMLAAPCCIYENKLFVFMLVYNLFQFSRCIYNL